MDPSAGESSSWRLVRVFTTSSIPEGLLVKGLLTSEGIPVVSKGEAEGPYRVGPMELWTPQEYEVQAKLLIEDVARAGVVTSDPPQPSGNGAPDG